MAKNRFEPRYMAFRLGQMILESLSEAPRRGRIRHLRQRLRQPVFRVVKILDLIYEKIVSKN